jgi:hypothetical protein
VSGGRVQGRDDVQRRDDVDLSVELQHGVAAVLVDTQMRSERRGLVAHDDITSNRVTGARVTSSSERRRSRVRLTAAKPFPTQQVTLDGVNFSMFD